MDKFDYSKDFQEQILRRFRGAERCPNYNVWLEQVLGGPNSRVVLYTNFLCPEIEFHCGSLRYKKVLDFGCGMGSTTAALAYFSETVCAFDIDKESLEICNQRIKEHGLESRVRLYYADDIDSVKSSMGTFDLILINGVIEHIPLSKTDLRKRIMLSLFDMLEQYGHLYINDTPNRLLPFDFHTTQLWWIPWTKPGSEWSYRRALRKGKIFDDGESGKGRLGLEEGGAWGATYWEILNYFEGKRFVCLNTIAGHNRHLYYRSPWKWWRALFEFIVYYSVVKTIRIPMAAFAQSLPNLVLQKL
jgi:2-polyprenyl-3-methyl-5-hydroxy-6-metoxy-1,4-benzoquinol methylase